ncbi:MAG: VOC family protein [Bacteroidota bacterium]
MATQLFLNLPVKDLNRSVDFFTKLGYTFNAQFTDENATCMIIDENIMVMLLVQPYFKSFIQKEVTDSSKSNEAIMALSVNSREEVDAIVAKAMGAGAGKHNDPQDHGFMYGHGFEDLDGHLWEVFWMNPDHVQ